MTSIYRMTTSFGQLLIPSICLFAILFISTSFVSGQRDASLDGLVNDIKENKILTWRLETNPTTHQEDIINSSIYQLRMWADGTYEEIEDGQQLEGLWTVDKKDGKIVFLCKSANGYELQGVNPPNFYTVESYSDTELILLWKSPNTSIRKIYKRLPTPYRG